MTESRALALVFVVGLSTTAIASAVLTVLRASGVLFALVAIVIIAIGAVTSSLVGDRYEAKQRGLDERREREEILLSR
jgi:uncharacterized protein involved in exopolysaccharide biosynthesis